MNLKAIGTTCLLTASVFALQAQIIDDVLRFSQSGVGATARFKAMGNAQTALGGDLSSLSGNPAGLGFFNQSDIGITLDYFSDTNKATYFGTTTNGSVNRAGLSQAGVVFHIPTLRARGSNLESGWLNFNLGAGYNRTNSFRSNLDFTGTNTQSSYTNAMADDANFGHYGGYLGDFGYIDLALVDGDGAAGNYFPFAFDNETYQEHFSTAKGNQWETSISFGANNSNRFYIGGALSFTGFNYEINRDFIELGYTKTEDEVRALHPGSEFLDPQSDLNLLLDTDYDLKYVSSQINRGRGVNGKLGMIFRPDPAFRIGLSGTTPTWYSVTHDVLEYADSWFVDPSTNQEIASYGTPEGEGEFHHEYNLRTPYRLNAGLAYIFGDGLVSGDVEFVDYKSMQYTYEQDRSHETSINNSISEVYRSALNYRLGAEYRIAPDVLLRAGYNYNSSPYQSSLGDRSSQVVSAGLGYRISNVYIDFTYQNASLKSNYEPYALETKTPPATAFTNTRNNVLLTIGAKF